MPRSGGASIRTPKAAIPSRTVGASAPRKARRALTRAGCSADCASFEAMRATKGEQRRAVTLCRRAGSRRPLLTLSAVLVQRARTAEPTRDLALDHHGALGAGALGERDVAVHGLALRRLQHRHSHLVDWHAHPRRRDLGLLLRIVGQPCGRKDRLIERRRFLAYLAGSILGVPGLAHGCHPFRSVSPQRDSLLHCTREWCIAPPASHPRPRVKSCGRWP